MAVYGQPPTLDTAFKTRTPPLPPSSSPASAPTHFSQVSTWVARRTTALPFPPNSLVRGERSSPGSASTPLPQSRQSDASSARVSRYLYDEPSIAEHASVTAQT